MMDRSEPTDRQLEILEFIARFIDREGVAPTIREIGAKFDITSTHGVSDHLKLMAKKGLLERSRKGGSRLLRITGLGWLCLKHRRGYAPPVAGRDLVKRVAAAIRMLERAGEPGYLLEVDDVIGVLRGTHQVAA